MNFYRWIILRLFIKFTQIYASNIRVMFLITIKLDRVSFETKGRQNLQKTADFIIESLVFCPLVPPSWISLVDPTSAMYASAIYVSYIYASTSPTDILFCRFIYSQIYRKTYRKIS